MKGIVFKELIALMEQVVGEELTEDIIEEANLDSGGSYSGVGTYDHSEILSLVTVLSEKTGKEASELVHAFGEHMVGVFKKAHGDFFSKPDTYSFLESVHSYIHVEVRKLYPEAELPAISCKNGGDGSFELHYYSNRPFADLAGGLIAGVIKHYGEKIDVKVSDIGPNGLRERTFFLKKG
ncbi:MAG: hypothetical protein CL677_05650 [Bdellovibrionaceae bacterium]|nr:hypothetical protein [Pseudobdellovibrionaceae bacterium]|tara:strand:+ start:14035 stop:14574 length:540 start_codon:yes stop_codon:yes gene_type:complete